MRSKLIDGSDTVPMFTFEIIQSGIEVQIEVNFEIYNNGFVFASFKTNLKSSLEE